jgi:hypothetical protein
MAGPGNAATSSGQLLSTTFLAGTPVVLDASSALYTALAPKLRALMMSAGKA